MLHATRIEPHYNHFCCTEECVQHAEFEIEMTTPNGDTHRLNLCPNHFYITMKVVTAEGLAFAEEDDAPIATVDTNTGTTTTTTTTDTGRVTLDITANADVTRSLLEGLAYQVILNVTDQRAGNSKAFTQFAALPTFHAALIAMADGTDMLAPREVCIAYIAKRLADDPATIAKMVEIANAN